jgi:hypothetical protein
VGAGERRADVGEKSGERFFFVCTCVCKSSTVEVSKEWRVYQGTDF